MPSASARPPVACPSIPALAVAAVAFLEALPPATAQARAEAAKIRIELNKTEQEGDACRVSLVFTNSGIDHYRGMTLDLVFLGKDDVILRRAAIDAAPLRPIRTVVKQYDVPDLSCGAVARVLLKDVTGCRDQDGAKDDCLARIELSHRNGPPFARP